MFGKSDARRMYEWVRNGDPKVNPVPSYAFFLPNETRLEAGEGQYEGLGSVTGLRIQFPAQKEHKFLAAGRKDFPFILEIIGGNSSRPISVPKITEVNDLRVAREVMGFRTYVDNSAGLPQQIRSDLFEAFNTLETSLKGK